MLKVHKLWVDDENVDFVSFQEWCFMLLFRRMTKDFDMRLTDAQVKGLIFALTKANQNLTSHRFQFLGNIFAPMLHFNVFFHWSSDIFELYTTKAFLNACPRACHSVQHCQGPNKILFEIQAPHVLEGAQFRFLSYILTSNVRLKVFILSFSSFLIWKSEMVGHSMQYF